MLHAGYKPCSGSRFCYDSYRFQLAPDLLLWLPLLSLRPARVSG